ncbi:hypothetical protein [Burkholderia cepacia]|uniref:hypothetical protein n=1 Tax=Burkholderia cepacia TaxID=292 RepID=UPI0015888665|nr:hypothetical protein [Burkholderia cepacia]
MKMNENKKIRVLVAMADEFVQEQKHKLNLLDKTPSKHFRTQYKEFLLEAWEFSLPYRIKAKDIQKLVPVFSRGRNGKFEGVKIIYEGE